MKSEEAKNLIQNSDAFNTTFIGTNTSRLGVEENIGISDDKRFLHTANTGPTGSGKTELMVNAAMQDIYKDHGICIIVPKGHAINEIIARLPEDRIEDVVYINPASPAGPPALNVLEPYITGDNKQKQKDIIVDDVVDLFKRRSENWGDRFGRFLEHLLVAHIQLNIENGESNNLYDLYECIHNDEKMEKLIQRTSDSIRRKQLQRIKNEYGSKELNPVEYRLEDFTGNELLRDIISADESGINFQEAVDDQKIILVELQKGEIGEETCQVIGSIVLTKIWSAIQSRVSQPEEERKPFHLYVDEMQNFGSSDSSLASMLAEGREYRLSLWLATQYLSRLDKDTQDAVVVNCRNKIVFQPSGGDSSTLAKVVDADKKTLKHLGEYQAVVQKPVTGRDRPVEVVETYPPWSVDPDRIPDVKQEQAISSNNAGEPSVSDRTGSHPTAGGDLHDALLGVADQRLKELGAQQVNIFEQSGENRADGLVVFPDGSRAYLEAENTTLSKPGKVLHNLKRSVEDGSECIFVVQEENTEKLENILEDPVNRDGDEYKDDDGSYSYYQVGTGDSFTDIEFVEEAEYRILEVTSEELTEYTEDVEAECPQLEYGFTKEELRIECVERTDDGYCQALGQQCVLTKNE